MPIGSHPRARALISSDLTRRCYTFSSSFALVDEILIIIIVGRWSTRDYSRQPIRRPMT